MKKIIALSLIGALSLCVAGTSFAAIKPNSTDVAIQSFGGSPGVYYSVTYAGSWLGGNGYYSETIQYHDGQSESRAGTETSYTKWYHAYAIGGTHYATLKVTSGTYSDQVDSAGVATYY